MRFILPSLWGLHLRHHRIVTESNNIILLFLIPMPTALLCLLNFSSFDMSPSVGLSYWILIQDPLSHSVLLCEWYVSYFLIHGRRGSCGHLVLYALRLMLFKRCFDMSCFFQESWLLISFSFFLFYGMGSFIYDKLSHSASSPRV